MLWKNARRSDNVDDRRGDPGAPPELGGGGGGGRGPGIKIGLGGLVVLAAAAYFLGINPAELLQVVSQAQGGGAPASSSPGQASSPGQPAVPGAKPTDAAGDFSSVVLADTEDTWTKVFASLGKQYVPPTLVLYRDQVDSACGYESAATGPFYCPGDTRLYLDTSFFDELRALGAPGDFAQAYVIAHEVGHHLQKLLGTTDQVERETSRADQVGAEGISVRVELQADCYAGAWAHSAQQRGVLEQGDVEEGLAAAASVGDDRLQRSAGRRVTPETWTHGSSEMRTRWFRRGFDAGDISQCDTFSAQSL